MSKDEFFGQMHTLGLALTYDDVRLKTGYAEVMPDDVKTETKFSKNVPLKIPIVSAAMDTVTEHELAIVLAKAGGLGIIHRNLSPEEQAKEVASVKNHLHGLIERPICVHEENTIQEILNQCEKKEYGFHTFPVVNSSGQIVGILTENDFDICDDTTQLAKDVMTKDLIVAEKETKLETAYQMMIKEKKKCLPRRVGGFLSVLRCLFCGSLLFFLILLCLQLRHIPFLFSDHRDIGR